MKKFIYTVIFAFLCVVNCFSQDRVDRIKLSFNNEGVILNTFTGWTYDKITGEWFDCVNMIADFKREQKHSTLPHKMSFKFNNIISLQFKTIVCNETPYYVLVWEKWEGAYEYPEIYEDWEYWKTKEFLMFTKQNMNKLKNLTNRPITIKVTTPSRGRCPQEIQDVDIIQGEMSNRYALKKSIVIYKATDGNIRFKFLRGYSENESIKYQYFEISEKDYNKLIDISF